MGERGEIGELKILADQSQKGFVKEESGPLIKLVAFNVAQPLYKTASKIER
jgi:hypothetical protein